MNKTTLNSFTTFIPILAIVLISIVLMFSPYITAKKIALYVALTAFPTQGLVIIFRKKVFIKYWLSKKEKTIDGLLWIIIGIVIIFLYFKETRYLK